MRLQTKMIGMIALLLLSLGVFVSIYFPSLHNESAFSSLHRKAESVGKILATAAAPSIDFFDVDPESIETVISIAKSDPDLAYIRVFSKDRRVIARLEPKNVARYSFSGIARAQRIFQGNTLHLLLPVHRHAGDSPERAELIGAIQMGYSLDFVNRTARQFRLTTVAAVGVALVLGMVAAFLVGGLLIRPLEELEHNVRALGAGATTVRARVRGSDEVSKLAMAFNQMVKALHDRTELANNTLAAMVDAVMVVDLEGTIQLVNRAACELLGHTGAELLGRSIYDLFADEDDSRSEEEVAAAAENRPGRSHIRQLLHEGRPIQNISIDLRVKSGELLAASVNGAVILDLDRVARACVVVARDIRETHRRIVAEAAAAAEQRKAKELERTYNELKAIHLELTETQTKLMEVSRLAGKADVATSILHNVGNVLNSVNVSASLVKDRLRSLKLDQLERLAGILRQNADAISHVSEESGQLKIIPGYLALLTTELLQEREGLLSETKTLTNHLDHIVKIVRTQQAYARAGGVEESADVKDIIEHALSVHQVPLQQNSVSVIREYSDLPVMRVDRHKLLQILINLLSNARHALCDVAEGKRILLVRTERRREEVYISITDSGIGIPKEHLSRIFEHGFTTRSDGHGFGLHASAIAAVEMGGRIEVRSDGIGTGATFTLVLGLPSANTEGKAE